MGTTRAVGATRSTRSATTGLDRLAAAVGIREMRSYDHFVDKGSSPSLLPILRSAQQAGLLALLLGDPDLELSLTDLADRLGMPYPSVHREVERAEAAGVLTSRKIGNTRLVRAETTSPYFNGLAEILTRAFGVPAVIADALGGDERVHAAYVFGSWAARHLGEDGQRPVGDIDVLVLGDPDRDTLYARLDEASTRLGRPIQVTIREADWLTTGTGSFHDTIVSRPMVPVPLVSASTG